MGGLIMAENTAGSNEVQKTKAKMSLKTIIILLAVFLLEGGAISLFFVVKGGPAPAEGSDPITGTEQNPEKAFAEVILAENYQVVNYTVGRSRIMVTLEVAAKVESEQKEQLEAEVKEHSKEILNTIRIVVAGADPLDIKQDPKLQVIKRDIRTGVENIVSEGLIQEILIPVWQPYSDE